MLSQAAPFTEDANPATITRRTWVVNVVMFLCLMALYVAPLIRLDWKDHRLAWQVSLPFVASAVVVPFLATCLVKADKLKNGSWLPVLNEALASSTAMASPFYYYCSFMDGR